jgi:hypothetical protein
VKFSLCIYEVDVRLRVQYNSENLVSDIVSNHPMFWSDMMGHLIILKRDVVSCQSTINQNYTVYQLAYNLLSNNIKYFS